MRTQALKFNDLVATIYELPLSDREELKNLLENNIAEARRKEIADNYKRAMEEQKSGSLEFSSNINELKKRL